LTSIKLRTQNIIYTFALFLIIANVYLFYVQLVSTEDGSVQHKADAVLEANVNVFNKIDPQQVFTDVIPERSKLQLIQIVQSGSDSVAWFTINGKKSQAFEVKQQITDNILLDKIESDRVQLKYLSSKELISLESSILLAETGPSKINTAEINPPVNVVVKDKGLAAFPLGVNSEGVEQLQINQYVIDRGLVNQQLSQGEVFRHAKFERQEEGGFKFKEIAENSIYDKIGLLEGDVVRQINGQPINDLTDIMTVYEQYSHQDQAQLLINRNGQAEFIYFLLQN